MPMPLGLADVGISVSGAVAALLTDPTIWSGRAVTRSPHQASFRARSRSFRVTRGPDSRSFLSEKNAWSPEAKCVVCARQVAISALVAQPAAPINTDMPSLSGLCGKDGGQRLCAFARHS